MYSHRVSCSSPVRRQWTMDSWDCSSIGNHNHHDKSYTIQLTTNGRHITCNRHHIKPTAVTADTYIQYQSTKQHSTRADPLAEILNNITKNPAAYVTRQTTNDSEQSNTKQKEEAKDNEAL